MDCIICLTQWHALIKWLKNLFLFPLLCIQEHVCIQIPRTNPILKIKEKQNRNHRNTRSFVFVLVNRFISKFWQAKYQNASCEKAKEIYNLWSDDGVMSALIVFGDVDSFELEADVKSFFNNALTSTVNFKISNISTPVRISIPFMCFAKLNAAFVHFDDCWGYCANNYEN